MLVCEVNLGKIYEQPKSEELVKKLPAGYDSVQGRGESGPDDDFLTHLPNGLQVPLGEFIQYPVKPEPVKKTSPKKFRESEDVNFGFTGFGAAPAKAPSNMFGAFGQSNYNNFILQKNEFIVYDPS